MIERKHRTPSGSLTLATSPLQGEENITPAPVG
jgi:hypothetical protein